MMPINQQCSTKPDNILEKIANCQNQLKNETDTNKKGELLEEIGDCYIKLANGSKKLKGRDDDYFLLMASCMYEKARGMYQTEDDFHRTSGKLAAVELSHPNVFQTGHGDF